LDFGRSIFFEEFVRIQEVVLKMALGHGGSNG
jgi:hypothetical protein